MASAISSIIHRVQMFLIQWRNSWSTVILFIVIDNVMCDPTVHFRIYTKHIFVILHFYILWELYLSEICQWS